MNPIYEKLLNCVAAVRKITDFEPKVAIVLGPDSADMPKTLRLNVKFRILKLTVFRYRRCPVMTDVSFLDMYQMFRLSA